MEGTGASPLGGNVPGANSPGGNVPGGNVRVGNAPVEDVPVEAARARPATAGPPDRERIAARAYELYQSRGGTDGKALDDWLEAERELSRGGSHTGEPDRSR